jgi:hypothetical protein
MIQSQGWQWENGLLSATTCLSCRVVVRECFERELSDGDVPANLDDQYDLYLQQQQVEEMWRIQAEWHQPGWEGDAACWDWHRPDVPISTSVTRGDRVRHRDYGDGSVIAASVVEADELVLVRFDARPEKPKSLSGAYLTVIRDACDTYCNWVGEGIPA